MSPECQSNVPDCPAAHQAAREAVKQVFAILGVDVDKPDQVEDFRKDLRFGQSMRRASDRGFLAVVVLICTAVAISTWTGIKINFGGH